MEVLIRGLKIKTCHGVHGYEKTTPQEFVFDADLQTDFYAAAKHDDIERACNYSTACKIINGVATGNVFNLIEKLAYECAFALLDGLPNVKSVKLAVCKPQAPIKLDFDTVGVTVQLSREQVYLSLGSSIGDRKNYLDTAVKKLDETRGIKVKKVSKYLETAPYGGVAQNAFLNCAVEIETYLAPENLLDEIHRIEEECGRVRKKRWDDRTLDIDIIFFGDKIIFSQRLVIPHPEYAKRGFVLQPLKEIAPGYICPDSKIQLKNLPKP